VDPGPSSTIPLLLSALKKLDIHSIDYILLTHIHIDHAGGTGNLLQHYPEALVICHSIGIPHLINPEKLWAGSLKVLGPIAEAFGPIQPVASDSIMEVSELKLKEGTVTVFPTPGHAPHHQSFLFDNYLFAGEALGTATPAAKDFYLRLATPPRFIYDKFSETIKSIGEKKPDNLCLAHYGFKTESINVINSALDQLNLWMEYIEKDFDKGNREPDLIFDNLVASDPFLKSLPDLPSDIRYREKYFAGNSIKGFLDYFKRKKEQD